MKLDFLNRVSGVRIPPSAPSKALRKECFLFGFRISPWGVPPLDRG